MNNKIDELFLKNKVALNDDFVQKTLVDAKIDECLALQKIALSDEFADKLLAQIGREKGKSAKIRAFWGTVLSAAAALALYFGYANYAFEPLPSDAELVNAMQNNVVCELEYNRNNRSIEKLGNEIDNLSATLLENELKMLAAL